MKLITFFVILIIQQLSTFALSATCPPGSYYQYELHRPPCHECFFAQYCPGNDNNYPCPKGTVTPHEGMISCDKCPTIRTNGDQTVCLLADTPKDAQEPDVNDDEFDVYTLDRKSAFWYKTISVYDLPVGQLMHLEYGFIPEHGKFDVPLTVFASVTTGQPNKSNFTWSTVSNNATIIIPYTRPDENTNFFIVYFNIVPSVQHSVKFLGKTFKGFRGKFSYIPNTMNSAVVKNNFGPENQVVLEWNNIPSVGRFNVSITLKEISHDAVAPDYSVCYSKQSQIVYPNYFNSNLVVSNGVNKQISIILENISNRVVRMGVVFSQLTTVQIDSELKILSNK